MRKINSSKKTNNDFSNSYRNLQFGVNYYDDLNEEYSEEMLINNIRDKNNTNKQVTRIHKPRNNQPKTSK